MKSTKIVEQYVSGNEIFIIKQRVLFIFWLTYSEYDANTNSFKPIIFDNFDDADYVATMIDFGAMCKSYSIGAYNSVLIFLIALGVFILGIIYKIL